MKKYVAKVREGRLTLNEPTELPEGTEVELEAVPDSDLSIEEKARLDAAIAESMAQIERGEFLTKAQLLERLRTRRG